MFYCIFLINTLIKKKKIKIIEKIQKQKTIIIYFIKTVISLQFFDFFLPSFDEYILCIDFELFFIDVEADF